MVSAGTEEDIPASVQSEVDALKALNIPDAQRQAQAQQEANLALMRKDTDK